MNTQDKKEEPPKIIIEMLPGDLSKFIPEIQYDEFGKEKKQPFRQTPYSPTSEYEG